MAIEIPSVSEGFERGNSYRESKSKKRQRHDLYQKKDGGLTAICQDGIRREVSPFISRSGQSIGWMARENSTNASECTAYPLERIDSRAGNIILRTIALRIATGQMEVPGDYTQWETTPAQQAVMLGYGLRSSHSSSHELFDITTYKQFQDLTSISSRRRKSTSC